MRKPRIAVGLVLAGVAVVAVIMAVSPSSQPVPLPAGVAGLRLRTLEPRWHAPWQVQGCPLALLRPVTVEQSDGMIAFTMVETGQDVAVVWPAGFSGRLVSGKAEIVSPEGWIVAREGDVLDDLGGSSADNGDFVVCFSGPDEYRP